MDFNQMDEQSLRALYSKKTLELEDALLSGALWHEIEAQRKDVVDISIALHKKISENGKVTPADFAIRGKRRAEEGNQEPSGIPNA
jgi:hypothetical protein